MIDTVKKHRSQMYRLLGGSINEFLELFEILISNVIHLGCLLYYIELFLVPLPTKIKAGYEIL